MVSSLADAPMGKCNEALEWVESRDNARHAQKAFSCSAGTNSSSSRSGNGDGGNGEGGSNNKRQCPVMVLVTASVRPDALLRSFDLSSTSDKKSVINDGSGGGPSDSSSSDSSEGDQGVRFLRACSSVPLFHAAGTVVRRNEACEAIDLSFKLLLFMNSAPESLLFATAPPMSVQCIEEIVWTK